MRKLAPCVLLAACFGGSEPAAHCSAASPSLLSEVAAQANSGVSLREGWTVPAPVEGWHFLSAEADGPGMEGDGHTLTFAVSSLGASGMVYAVDLAAELTRWPDARSTRLGFTGSERAAQDSRACVQAALR